MEDKAEHEIITIILMLLLITFSMIFYYGALDARLDTIETKLQTIERAAK